MTLIKKIDSAIWCEYHNYREVFLYIDNWHVSEVGWSSYEENFKIEFKDPSNQQIDLLRTLHNIDDETLLKIAIDIGVETPYFIPSIPIFKNEVVSEFPTSSLTFEKSLKLIDSDPDTAIGLANSALESIIKEILKDKNIRTQWKENDTLYSLAQSICKEYKITFQEVVPAEIVKIGSSLLNASQAIEKIRSEKTNFHGKMQSDYIITDPLYAYFVINSVATIGHFLLAFYHSKYKSYKNEQEVEE